MWGYEMKKQILESKENEEYLTTQIITYLGNKRSLLSFIGDAVQFVKDDLGKNKIDVVDMFSGSGVVARYLKQHSRTLIVNDLEKYSYVLNDCYLSNVDEINIKELKKWYKYVNVELGKGLKKGFISELYAPKDINSIKKGERCFFTTKNAMYIDTCRQIIEKIPYKYKKFFLAPLITEASIKNNTAGVFKGFYKNSKTGIGQFGGNDENALSRIKKDIELPFPVFSNFSSTVKIYNEDANELVKKLKKVDLMYFDPPYNQHPYGSNYFMLNLINDYKKPCDISEVSGIPKNWNRSKYNKAKDSLKSFTELCKNANATYLLISFNSDGFIKLNEMKQMLTEIGTLKVFEQTYNTFRGSRNLRNRDIHVKEYLYLVKKY